MIFAGSKTFLVGEYSVLFGGGAIVLVTTPKFQLKIKNGETQLIGIEKHSPAHCFYQTRNFDGLSIEFCDPHNGSGGFGASSAQFAMLYRLHLQLIHKKFDIDSFLTEYRQLSNIKNIAPSGADCVAQYFDHSIYFDSKNNTIEKVNWNFPNLDFMILKTKCKIATHLHLRELAEFNIDELQRRTFAVGESFCNIDEAALIENVQCFFNLLVKNNLVVDDTIKIVDKLLKIDGIKAAKGCGALGADTILIIFEKKNEHLMNLISQHLLPVSYHPTDSVTH
ncbi:MAG: hypothetical protein LBB21_04695 [Holosporaceae bacterium]|jgi:mevalonate kinase|nr:hypothetical protein [Holosporaceae bacterium]